MRYQKIFHRGRSRPVPPVEFVDRSPADEPKFPSAHQYIFHLITLDFQNADFYIIANIQDLANRSGQVNIKISPRLYSTEKGPVKPNRTGRRQ